jgi:hypothetical protein
VFEERRNRAHLLDTLARLMHRFLAYRTGCGRGECVDGVTQFAAHDLDELVFDGLPLVQFEGHESIMPCTHGATW